MQKYRSGLIMRFKSSINKELTGENKNKKSANVAFLFYDYYHTVCW